MQRFFLILFVLASASLSAQQQHHFRLGASFQRTRMVDKQASPLAYESSGKTFSFGYTRYDGKGRFDVGLNGSLGDFFPSGFAGRKFYNPGYNADGSPKRDSFPMIGNLYSGRLSVGYAKRLSALVTDKKLLREPAGYAGLSLNNQLFYSDNIVRSGWINTATVNADYFQELRAGRKHFFELKLSIPLFGAATRLPYHKTVSTARPEGNLKTLFRQGTHFASVFDLQNVNLSFDYRYALSKRFDLGLQYSGQWLRYSREQPVTLFQDNIGLAVYIK
jgi:hypothetical protein